MQSILSDAVEMDGSSETRVEINLDGMMPDGIAYYTVQALSNVGGDPVCVIGGGDPITDPTKCGARVQMYPQTFGPFAIARGNPALIIGASGADTVAYTVYALTDGAVDYGR